MVKDKHEEPKTAPNSVPPKTPPALAEGHSPKSKVHSDTRTGVHDDLLPVDSVPGTEYYLAINDDGSAGALSPIGTDIPVGAPVLRVFHTDQVGQDKLLSKGSGAPLGPNLQPTPDFRFKTPDAALIKKSNEKYADNRRAHDHENAHRADHK